MSIRPVIMAKSRIARLLVVAAVAAPCSVALADCGADAATTRPHLVELYSSEGCSSCPPAEGWLRTLHDGADVVALEFHVDYWDGLGWKDRFSDPRYTARQKEQARRDGGTSVFTPQVALDGRNWSQWYRGGGLTAPPARADVALHLTTEITTQRVHVESTSRQLSAKPPEGLRVYAALVENGLATQVLAGENRGASLKHDHVVRAFAGPLPFAHAAVDLPVAADVNLNEAAVIVFAQNPHTGEVAQVVAQSLAQCRR
jgi:hypothetical protein